MHVTTVPFASGVLRRLGQRSRESFLSLFVELFQVRMSSFVEFCRKPARIFQSAISTASRSSFSRRCVVQVYQVAALPTRSTQTAKNGSVNFK